MIKSQLGGDAHTTIPEQVREALGIAEGDEIAYQIEGDRVTLSKLRVPQARDDAFPAFHDRDAEAERSALDDLRVRRNGSRSFPL